MKSYHHPDGPQHRPSAIPTGADRVRSTALPYFGHAERKNKRHFQVVASRCWSFQHALCQLDHPSRSLDWPIIHPDASTRRRAAQHAGTKAPQG
jgi:hypothetical protein